MKERMELLEKQLDEIKGAVMKLAGKGGSNSGNIVRIEGAGSIWNGLALGVALGGTILGMGWMASKIQEYDISVRQAEAYKSAIYMIAPRLAKEIDEELDRQKEREQ